MFFEFCYFSHLTFSKNLLVFLLISLVYICVFSRIFHVNFIVFCEFSLDFGQEQGVPNYN
jgi:hypothetical protein